MSENETFLEEDAFAPAEQFGEGNSVIGGDSTVPDGTILGDLKDLAGLTFGTRWSQSESAPRSNRGFLKRRPVRRRSTSDRTSDRIQPVVFDVRESREGEGRPSGERRSHRFENRRHESRVILPPFEVQFYQEDASFNLLIDEMRKSCKTYELFAVARLILQKPERFVAAVRRRPDREGVRLPLYLSLLDDWIFSSEHEAMAYILQHHIEEFFDVVEEVVEAPKGRFTCVHRCGITKKLLSAPNYHRYRAILRAHFESEIHSVPFERFIAKIETTKEESDIQNWIQQMSRRVTYVPKVIDETVTDLTPRDSLDGAKNYLLQHFKDRILREVTTIRIAGTAFESMPSRAIVHAIQFFLQRQRNFPFDTASNLRYGFRRAGFSMYRKGKEGISYVCAAKRKFRTESDVFEASIQALIDFLESCETITLPTLQRDYIEANHLPEKEVLEGLDWLIREGYVVHYDNGTLLLNPKIFPHAAKVGEWVAVKSVERSIIPLEKMETAVEKLSDGTLSIAQTTTLAAPDDNIVSPLVEDSNFSDGEEREADESESKTTNGEDFDDGIKNEVDELGNKTTKEEDHSVTMNILDH